MKSKHDVDDVGQLEHALEGPFTKFGWTPFRVVHTQIWFMTTSAYHDNDNKK